MSDHRAILAAYDHARAGGLPAVLATVVGARGSTYRKPGARMLLVGDGTRVGVVSGGCLEGDVARRAWFLKTPGDAELVTYDTGSGDDATYEFGLGCRGVVEVLLERLDTDRARGEPPIVAALRAAVDRRATTTYHTTVRGPSVGVRTSATDGAAVADDVIVERLEPPIRLVIFGSGVDIAPVARIARAVGWQVVVVDHRRRGESAIEADVTVDAVPGHWQRRVRIDARTAAVLMTHRMDDDAAYLADVIAAGVTYVGCLGPRSRTEILLDACALTGMVLTDADRATIRAPVGLDLAAERPEEIALAIVAEVQAIFAGGSGVPLRERDGPIHAVAPATPVAARGARSPG